MRTFGPTKNAIGSLALFVFFVGLRNPEDSSARPVWKEPGVNFWGTPSRDGRYLSFVDAETGDLALRELASGKTRRLTHKDPLGNMGEFAYFSTISPAGAQVAYAWFNNERFYDLRVVGLDGSEPRVIYRNAEAGFVRPSAWSPDGKQILTLLFRKDNISQIALVSVADGAVRTLKSMNWVYPKKMDLSPDGRHIVYDSTVREGSSARDLFMLSIDGSSETLLVEHPADDLFPVWTPDGRGVLFASDRAGTMDLWMIEVTNGKAQGSAKLVKQNVGRFMPMGITAAGSYYYGVREGMTDVYIAEFDGEKGALQGKPALAARRLLGANRSPDWSPDGRFLAYLSQVGPENFGQESRVISIHCIEGAGGDRTLSPRLAFLERLRWSPDGSALLVSGSDGRGRGGLFRVDVQSGEVNPILHDRSVSFRGLEGVWSADGKAIFYVHQDAGEGSEIRRRDLESGEEQSLYRPEPPAPLYQLALSPDGTQLAFASNETSGASTLLTLSTSGGEPRQLLRARNGELSGVEWARDGKHLLVSTPDTPIPSLWQVSLNGGQPKKLSLSLDREGGVRLHPRGRHIAFTAGKTTFEVWALENFLSISRHAEKSRDPR